VSMTAMFVLAAVSAVMFLPMVPFPMMAALDIRIIGEFSFDKRFYSLIGSSGDTAVQLNSGFSKSILRTHTDSSADQRIYTQPGQKTCQCAMAAAIRINRLLFCDLTVFHVIDFKLLCVSEMLIYISVFKCYCYPHCVFSFHCYNLRIQARRSAAFLSAEMNRRSVAQTVVSSRDQKDLSVYNTVRYLFAGAFVNLRHRSPRNIHPFCTLLMSQLLQIDQSDHFILINRQG